MVSIADDNPAVCPQIAINYLKNEQKSGKNQRETGRYFL